MSLRVFLSSTFLDNGERRAVVRDVVQIAGLTPVDRFTASDEPTVEVCKRLAAECDVYVGIIAHRYGWIPPGHESSITEIEYAAAKAAGRPRLMFEIDPNIAVIIERDFDELPDRFKKQELLEAFRAKFRADQMPARFTETTLSGLVSQALYDFSGKRPTSPPPSTETRVNEEEEIERYRSKAIGCYKDLELAGFKSRLRIPISLERLHVPLHAVVDLRLTADSTFGNAAEAENKLRDLHAAHEIPLSQAFHEIHRRQRRGIVILGDPGSGKTTHLKSLLLWCLSQEAGRGPARLGLPADLLPVFLPLRNLRDPSQGLGAFIEQELDAEHLAMPPGFGACMRKRGHLLLLFDGLDEVADATQRATVARWIEEALVQLPNCVPVVTCRFAGYHGQAQLEPEFLELHLRPLTAEQSEAFVRNWYRIVETALAADTTRGESLAIDKAEELLSRLREPGFRSARMAEMTRNPLLLANLCLVHRDRGSLPRGRARLYQECIDVLLEHQRGDSRLVPIDAVHGHRVLQPAAWWLHAEEGRTRATAAELAPVLEPALQAVGWQGGSAVDLLRRVRDESGVLTGWGQQELGFMHLGFQEYLAAQEIRRRFFEGEADILRELATHFGASWWQEVILLLLATANPSLFLPFMREATRVPAFADNAELLGLILEEAAERSALPFVELASQEPGADAELWRRQMQALLVLERIDASALQEVVAKVSQHPSPVVQEWLRARRRAENQAAVGRCRRTDIGGVEMIYVPGGSFAMGSPQSENRRSDDEGPQHKVTLGPFWIGKYPVTNEEYARFLEANPQMPTPFYWGDRQFNQGRQPVIGVSWWEARAFSEWIGGRLPSEAEWEYAARAGTTETYVCGASPQDLRRFAWHIRNSQEVTHPVGEWEANPWGLHDVLGNAWEWVEDEWHPDYRNAPGDGSAWVNAPRESGRVIRGGSYYLDAHALRVAIRHTEDPNFHFKVIGFRCAQDP